MELKKPFVKTFGSIGHGPGDKRSRQMELCMNEVRAVVEGLPGNAQKIWNRAFQEALLEVQGDMDKAAAMAWRAFKRKEQRTRQEWEKVKAARGMLLVAAYGGTPEWIRLAENYGLVLSDCRCPCLVDRRALDAIVSHWEQSETGLMVYLEDHKVNETVVPVVGWIKEMKVRSDGLWIMVEWTEKGLGYITSREFGYLGLGFILDEDNRPMELWQAKLTDYSVLHELGQEFGIYSAQGFQAEPGRKLRLIKRVNRPEVFGADENWENLKQGEEGKWKEHSEIRKFLQEMKELFQLQGEVSLTEVKHAVLDLKIQLKICQGLKELGGMLGGLMSQGMVGKAMEGIIERDSIKLEQGIGEKVRANQEWQDFKEYLEIGAQSATKKKKRVWGFPFFYSLLKWALKKSV
jgi:hypothetical protein